jgi:biotin transport system substrate-specific component
MQQVASLSIPRNFFHEAIKIWGASILIALGAQISIPLPFNPVPITFGLQTLILLSAMLGSKRSFAMILTYLAQGIIGLPVFSKGGSGIAWLLGPTGGYLVGYIFVAVIVGWLMEKLQSREGIKVFSVMLFGNALAFLFGVPFLSRFIGWEKAIQCGLVPFIGVDFFKLIFAYHLFVRFNKKGS